MAKGLIKWGNDETILTKAITKDTTGNNGNRAFQVILLKSSVEKRKLPEREVQLALEDNSRGVVLISSTQFYI